MSASHSPLAARRANGPHTSMFLRMLVRAAVLRRGRAASALLAMIIAAGVTTAMLNLYVDVQAKLRGEFRNYGANLIVTAKDGSSLPADALARVDRHESDQRVRCAFVGLQLHRRSIVQSAGPVVVVSAIGYRLSVGVWLCVVCPQRQ